MRVVFADEEERVTPRLTGSLQDLYEAAFAEQICEPERSSMSFRASIERKIRDWMNHSSGLGRTLSPAATEKTMDALVCHAMVSSAYRSFNSQVSSDIVRRWEEAGTPLDSRWMQQNFDVCRPLRDRKHVFD